MIRDILVKYFHVFPQHFDWNISESPKVNQMLFFMPGNDKWKRVRSILSPTFTSGKLKAMMSNLSDITEDLVKTLGELQQKGIWQNLTLQQA